MIKITAVVLLLVAFSCKDGNIENKELNLPQAEASVDNYSQNLTLPFEADNESIDYSYSSAGENTESKDCSEAHSSGDDAYSYSKKAYNSADYDEMKNYLKKSMNSFEDAMSNAEECKCEDAYSSADEGYTYARKGYRSDDYDEMKNYARKAKSSADDVMSNADNCTNE